LSSAPGEQEGKLIAERIYFDNDTVMRQIRGECGGGLSSPCCGNTLIASLGLIF